MKTFKVTWIRTVKERVTAFVDAENRESAKEKAATGSWNVDNETLEILQEEEPIVVPSND